MYKPIINWSKREIRDDQRYILIWVPEHPKSFDGGWYYLHRIVWEAEFGRLLKSYETVEHIGNRHDNSLEATIVCYERDHQRINKCH